jgi:threonine dehydrogenase-like Zn-dependent dehydrogenase
VLNAPIVLGHEAAGEVVQLGGGVVSLRVGTRVALEPGVPCWQSKLAREGRYNLDPDVVFSATPPHHGTLMRFVDHPGTHTVSVGEMRARWWQPSRVCNVRDRWPSAGSALRRVALTCCFA